jgi:hypothetical protein
MTSAVKIALGTRMSLDAPCTHEGCTWLSMHWASECGSPKPWDEGYLPRKLANPTLLDCGLCGTRHIEVECPIFRKKREGK